MISLPLLNYRLKTRSHEGFIQTWDPIRKAWVALTPEEHVRQLLLQFLLEEMNYPPALMSVERALAFGHTMLRFDLAVFNRETHEAWLLAECKAPNVPLNNAALHQLLRYHSKMPACRYWLITNGHQTFCADANDKEQIVWLDALPPY